jgi:hypothetical protein
MVPHRDVHGATDDLERTIVRVDHDQSNTIGSLDRPNLIDACDDDVLQSFADVLDSLDDETEVI